MTVNCKSLRLPKVIVAQIGARHNYAVPRMLHDLGGLAALQTDMAWTASPGVKTEIFRHAAKFAPGLRRRLISGVPKDAVAAFWEVTALSNFKSIAQRRGISLLDFWFSKRCLNHDVKDANIIYSMFGTGEDYLKRRKSSGLKIAVEIFITPIAHRIEECERADYPGWDEGNYTSERIELLEAKVARVIALSDSTYLSFFHCRRWP